MAESIAPLVADGAARGRHSYLLYGFDSALLQRGARGTVAGAGTISSNWGFSGEGTTYLSSYQGSWIYRQRGGAFEIFDVRAPIQVQRPPFRKWFPLPQLYVFAFLLAWPDNTWLGTEDNGIFFSYQNVPQIVAGAGQGFEIVNNGGTVQLAFRGAPGVLQATALSTVASPINPQLVNLFRIELRQPTSSSDGSIGVLVNDDAVARVSVSTADANWPTPSSGGQSGLMCGVGAGSSTKYTYFRDVTYYHGPDVSSSQGM